MAGAAFAADGAALVAFTVDGRLAYLDARTGRILRTAGGGHGPGVAIKLAPDRRFAGAGLPPGPRSGPVSVWDLESNREIWSGWVPQFGTPLRWDIDPDSLSRRACDIVRRNLTTEEWAAVLPDRPYQQTCPE